MDDGDGKRYTPRLLETGYPSFAFVLVASLHDIRILSCIRAPSPWVIMTWMYMELKITSGHKVIINIVRQRQAYRKSGLGPKVVSSEDKALASNASSRGIKTGVESETGAESSTAFNH